MKRINDEGFSAVEIMLLVTVIAVIGFVGYFVYSSQSKSNNSIPSNSVAEKPTNTTTDTLEPTEVKLLSGTESKATAPTADELSTIDKVSFVRPIDWRPDANITAEGCRVILELADCLGQVYIVPENEDNTGVSYPDYFVVTVSAFKTNQDAKTIFASKWQDPDVAAADAYSSFTTSDGVAGFKYDFAFNGTAPNGEYTEHVAYGISNGSYVAILDVTYFNGSHNSFPNTNKTDYGQYAAAVEQIAKSMRITP